MNTSTLAWDNLSNRRDLGTTALALWILSSKDKTGDDARELVAIPAIDGHFQTNAALFAHDLIAV
jgi:hypothetical protein